MSENRRSSEEEVRELLQEAGQRRPLPAADLAIIRAAARREWEQGVRSSSASQSPGASRSMLAVAAVVLIALLAAWWWTRQIGQPMAAAVAIVEVSTHPAAGLAVGAEIAMGASLETPVPMAIRLVGGQSLRLAPKTSIELLSAVSVRLDRGAIYIDSGPGVLGESIEVSTRHGVIREVGTQFEVRVDATGELLRIRVREGEVIMRAHGESGSALAGEELVVRADGSVRKDSIATFGEEWRWVEDLAMPFILDESSFATYLEWLARETGWQIEFEDEELRRAASGIVLYGSLGNASPRQSLETAFLVSGLKYRLEPGRLEILRQ